MAEYRCSSCKDEYKSRGGVKYCVKCQEYTFSPYIERRDDFPTRPPEKVQRRSSSERENSSFGRKRSECADGRPQLSSERENSSFGRKRSECADGRPQLEGSVWSCSGNLPIVQTDIHITQGNTAKYLQCGMHCRQSCSLCSRTEDKDKEAAEIQTTQGVDVNEDIQKITFKTVQELHTVLENLRNDLEKVKESRLREIQSFRQDINKRLDDMEQASVAELENAFKEMSGILQNNLDDLHLALDHVSKDNYENKERQEKLLKNSVRETSQFLHGDTDLITSSPVFVKNTKLLEILKSFNSLGAFDFPRKHDMYQIGVEETVNIAHEDDKEVCSIQSACFTDCSNVLLADYKNKNVKVLDFKDFRIKDVLALKHYPVSVCKISDGEAALGLAETLYFGGSNWIQFLSTKDKLVPTRTVKLSHCCTGICVVGGELFVSNQRKRLYVYNLDGELQNTVRIDQTGSEIFSKSYTITKSDNGKMVHVTDLNKGLVALDRTGTVLWTFSGPELKMAWGVCTDGYGNCFVAGSNSSNVVQIGPSGDYIGEVVPASYGIKDPQAVCFDMESSRLLVTRYNCNSVHIFSLN